MIAALIALPALRVLGFGSTPLILAAGAFLMQFRQGSWGVIPVHLNELSASGISCDLSGCPTPLGNLLAAVNLNLQVESAEAHGRLRAGDADVVGTVAVVITECLCPERLGIPGERRASSQPSYTHGPRSPRFHLIKCAIWPSASVGVTSHRPCHDYSKYGSWSRVAQTTAAA